MKNEILKLREEGKSYKQIQEALGCALSTIAYHCGDGQKEKQKQRNQENRATNVISKKIARYDRRVKDKTEDFQRERNQKRKNARLGKRDLQFSWTDVVEKFGWETQCYLTGRKVKLAEPSTYQFDHVVPVAKGGTNNLDNLGICCREANQAKYDMSVTELLELCKEILDHHGYKVEKR